jgi:hypothetical protein
MNGSAARYNRWTSAILLGVTLGVVVLGAAIVLSAGTADASTTSTATNNSTELVNETVPVDNQTRAVYFQATNTTAAENGSVTVTFYGVDDAGNETMVRETNVSAGANETELVEQSANVTAYDSYRVEAHGEADSTEVGTIEKVAGVGGGGGGLFDSTGVDQEQAIVGILLLGLVALAGYRGRD